ncbi:MAG TPA: ATP-dependent DNA ligase [Cytophagaceae bacterium]|jgi:DNA ligase-1
MKNFAALFSSLYQTNKTKEKVNALREYFEKASDTDKVWALAVFTDRKPKKPVNSTFLRTWAIEYSEVPVWLFEESYHVVGDLAEAIALMLPLPERESGLSLTEWINIILDMHGKDDASKKEIIIDAWKQLTTEERFVFNKLLTGSLRVGASQNLAVLALADLTKIDRSVISHRLMGNWDPLSVSFHDLLFGVNEYDDITRPYPFFLAYAIEDGPEKLGAPEEWQAEWKWDGIRSQLIRRMGNSYIWSRGEELVTDKFPEIKSFVDLLPDGTVLDGELLPFVDGKPLPFNVLQTRIGRKNLSAKILSSAPIVFMSYDVMEFEGRDLRPEPLAVRRKVLQSLLQKYPHPAFQYSTEVPFNDWKHLTELRLESRTNLAEGFMIKRRSSPYLVGRKRGDWWKWKIDPYTVDGVLVYAQKGHGRRADLYTDYTFAIWNEGKLVPFAKAYSGLTDVELKQVDAYIRRNIKEKFGPVRTVNPELVFEIAFEGIQLSTRHKCGVAVRFPRILRWRKDKKAEEADSLETVKQMMQQNDSLV